MVYKSFYFRTTIQIILILVTCYLIGFLEFKKEYIHSIIGLNILLILQGIWLANYVNRTNRMLSQFFSSIKEIGTSAEFDKLPHNAYFKELNQKMNQLNDLVRANRIEKENEHHYLKYLVEHLNTGVLSIIENNKIDVINKAGLNILGVNRLVKMNDLKQFGKDFYKTISSIHAGEQSLGIAIIQNEIIQLSIRASEFKLFNKQVKLISFHDIHKELDQKEIDAWQKVIKVLAHEILSSVSPIRSLSGHLENLLNKEDQEQLKYIGDAKEGLHIIHERSEGLMKFVDTYRQLSDIPRVNIQPITIKDIINNLKTICKSEFNIKPNVMLNETIEHLYIQADKNLLIQASINIIRNSIQAINEIENPSIIITGSFTGNKITIQIADNGIGIDEEDLENIFIPFFTTKEGGSGVGLTISKQLITLQGGLLEVKSKKNKGTTVSIKFESY